MERCEVRKTNDRNKKIKLFKWEASDFDGVKLLMKERKKRNE